MNGNTLAFVVALFSVLSLAALFTIVFLHGFRTFKEEISQGRRDVEFINKRIKLEKKEKDNKVNVSLVVGRTVTIVLSTVVAAFFAFAVINRINGDRIVVGNKTQIVIATGSMSEKNEVNDYLINLNLNNQFDEYSIIEVQKVREEQLYQYDVIAFKDDKGQTIVHRIKEIDRSGSEVRYVTRGDANNANDSYKPYFDDVIGRYTGFKVNSIGVLVLFMQSNSGIVTMVGVFYILILFFVLFEKLEKQKRDRIELLFSIIEYDLDDDNLEFTDEIVQNIIHNNTVYRFKDNEFVEKDVITVSETPEVIEEVVTIEETEK